MSRSGYSLVLKEASLLDVEEIKADVPPADLTVIQPSIDGDSHNELATIIILTLSAPVLTAVTMWLLRTTVGENFEYKVTIRKPDGSEIDVHLKIKRSYSEAPKAQIIKQIAAALKIPEEAVLAAST